MVCDVSEYLIFYFTCNHTISLAETVYKVYKARPHCMSHILPPEKTSVCIRGTSHGPVSVCVCLCLSVTSQCSTKTAKRRITQTTPHDTPGTLVFCCQRSPRNSTGVTPYEGAECRWGGQNRRLSTYIRLYLENGER